MTTITQFSCGESLNIVNANSLQSQLLKAVENSSSIEIRADQVIKCDTAGLQLFISLKEEISESGGQIIWKNPSKSLIENAKKLGVDQTLGLSN